MNRNVRFNSNLFATLRSLGVRENLWCLKTDISKIFNCSLSRVLGKLRNSVVRLTYVWRYPVAFDDNVFFKKASVFPGGWEHPGVIKMKKI